MSIDISERSAEFLDDQVAAGVFPTRRDAIDEAVGLLKARTELLQILDEAQHQLDTGDYTDYDEEGLAQFFEELKARCVARSAESER